MVPIDPPPGLCCGDFELRKEERKGEISERRKGRGSNREKERLERRYVKGSKNGRMG